MLDKLFSWGKKKEDTVPAIPFGRYSDNNKSVEKTKRWTDADNLFKEKKYHESINAFFDYLSDDAIDNAVIKGEGANFTFEIYQGSKIVRGSGNAEHMQAEVTLAKMPQPSVPVMRRLLEQNFALYYSRYALDGDRLCMRFDSDIETANPNKLYYGLKELATKADKQDDLLVQDFSSLQTADTEHINEIAQAEKETKYSFMQQWIQQTLDYCATLDADKFSGGIAYMLLTLAYRIDFLICPEGSLLSELEKIPGIYFAKDEKQSIERNALMIEAFKKLQSKPKEDVFKNLFRSKSTFAIVQPQVHKTIADAIAAANNNMIWYRDNNYPLLAEQICEYGISYCQYNYSLPKPITELFVLFMRVNYPAYFSALGFSSLYSDAENKKLDTTELVKQIDDVIRKWKAKYPLLEFNTINLKYDNLTNFNHSFTQQIEILNFDAK